MPGSGRHRPGSTSRRKRLLTAIQLQALEQIHKTGTVSSIDSRTTKSLLINGLAACPGDTWSVTDIGLPALSQKYYLVPDPEGAPEMSRRGRPLKQAPKQESHYRLMMSESLRKDLDDYCLATDCSLAVAFRQACKLVLKDVQDGEKIDFSEKDHAAAQPCGYRLSMTQGLYQDVQAYCAQGKTTMAAFFRVAVRRMLGCGLAKDNLFARIP